MKTQQLGSSDLRSTRLIYGCMRIVGTWNPAEIDAAKRQMAFAALDAAWEAGYTHFDHADIYCRGGCESVFGEWLRDRRHDRSAMLITTKCGIRWPADPTVDAPHRYDFSREHIVWSCEQSMKRLGIDTIDVYLLHRPDVLMNPPEIAEAFGQLRAQGKVRHFGVSNFTIRQIEDLQASLDPPLVCNQIMLHPGHVAPIEDGTLNGLRRLGVTPTLWSPVAGGAYGDGKRSDKENERRVQDALDTEAAALGVSRTVVTMAYLMKLPSRPLPIIGTVNPDRIRDSVNADNAEISREAWYRIYLAARGQKLP